MNIILAFLHCNFRLHIFCIFFCWDFFQKILKIWKLLSYAFKKCLNFWPSFGRWWFTKLDKLWLSTHLWPFICKILSTSKLHHHWWWFRCWVLRQWSIGWSTIEGLNIWAASRCRLTKVKFCDHIMILFNKVVNSSLDFILELVGGRFENWNVGQHEC